MVRQFTIVAVTLALLTPGLARDTSADLSMKAEALITEAKKVQLEATDISNSLRAKQFDLEKVKGMMNALTAHVESVSRMVAEIEPMEASMTEQQRAKFDQVKSKAQLLTIFAANKQDLLLGNRPERNRSMLRAKANGLAKRSEMLQQSAMALQR